MNWNRVRREDQATADRRTRHETSSTRVTFAAKYRSTCGTCDTTIDVGDRVASTLVAGTRTYHHERCIHPSAEVAAGVAAARLDDAAAALAGSIPDGRCHGTTKAGKPCAGGAKHGELYCGPHLDKMLRDVQRTSARTPKAAGGTTGYDPFYDNPF